MLYYARSDTHYLLFVYDCLRNLLVEGADGAPDLVRQVLTASEQTAGRVFERELYDEETGFGPNGWDIFAKKYGKKPIGAVKSVLLAVHSWRDRVAREEDESLRCASFSPFPQNQGISLILISYAAILFPTTSS